MCIHDPTDLKFFCCSGNLNLDIQHESQTPYPFYPVHVHVLLKMFGFHFIKGSKFFPVRVAHNSYIDYITSLGKTEYMYAFSKGSGQSAHPHSQMESIFAT